MASFVGKILFSSALFCFFLAFIFAIVGYSAFWLVPRTEYIDGTQQVDGVGLRQVCFTNFKFIYSHDKDRQVFDGCYANIRDSARFESIDVDAWSPRWFQTVQDMHLACIIMLVFNLLLIAGFLAIYFYASFRKNRGKLLSPCLLICKAATALWFIVTFIIGILLIAECLIFYVNYESSATQFYHSEFHSYAYGPGFGVTIGGGIALFISAGLATAIFCGLVRNIVRTAMHPPNEQDYYSQTGSQYSASEVDRLSMSEIQSRKDPDGVDDSEMDNRYEKEPSVRGDRRSAASFSRDFSDGKLDGERPVPAPRRSLSSKDVSREPSVARDVSDPPTYDQVSSQHSGSQAPSVRSARPQQFKYDFKPGYGYVPKPARPASDVESQYSSANQRASLSPHAPPTAGGRLYVPPSRTSYAGSTAGYSDVDSQPSERNRSVSRSAVSPQAEAPSPATSPQKVIKPKESKNPKHSRYAASGW